jgi:hypothetical protein
MIPGKILGSAADVDADADTDANANAEIGSAAAEGDLELDDFRSAVLVG